MHSNFGKNSHTVSSGSPTAEQKTMVESTGKIPETLHRLLELLQVNGFARNEQNALELDFFYCR
jgi:DNA-binding IclR family transcriptional regulator